MNLKEKVKALIEKAKICNMTLKWLIAGKYTKDLYDFVNVFKEDLYQTNFSFSTYERTITDEYTSNVNRTLYITNNDFLTKVIMPNVNTVDTYGFRNCSAMTYCELGQIISTLTNAFQGCEALETFKIKPESTGNIYLQYSPNLTVETLENIVENLADMTGQDMPTLSIGSGNLAKLSDEYIAMLNQKNWNYQ